VKERSEVTKNQRKKERSKVSYLAGMSPYISLKNKEKTLRASYDGGTKIFDYMD
jgi:hypothetical protein